MPDAELTAQVVEASHRLIEASADGSTTGEAVAEAIGRDPNDSAVYHAFWEAKEQRLLRLDFPGGMQLPGMVRRQH